MCLALNARDATRNVDALFKPTKIIREAAARVAASANVPEECLNDAVKGYLSPRGDFDPFLELPHLRVFVAQPAYLLAMKCAAMRIGEEFHGLDDVRYLLRYLNISTVLDSYGRGDQVPRPITAASQDQARPRGNRGMRLGAGLEET